MTAYGVIRMGPKQPYEIRQYQVNVTPYITRGETLSGGAARIYAKGTDPDAAPLDAMLYSFAWDPEKNLIGVRIQSGTTGETYRCRVRLTTAEGSRYEIEFEFKVKEVV